MADPSKEELVAALEEAVSDTLAYFERTGQTTTARIDRWGAWEVLAHFPYWHYATTWGIISAATGGPPWQLPGTADEINAACLTLHQADGFPDLIHQLRRSQERLVRAAADTEDLDAPVFRMPDGRLVSVRQRLETIARHWRTHLRELQESGG